jgi:hypothetical protein
MGYSNGSASGRGSLPYGSTNFLRAVPVRCTDRQNSRCLRVRPCLPVARRRSTCFLYSTRSLCGAGAARGRGLSQGGAAGRPPGVGARWCDLWGREQEQGGKRAATCYLKRLLMLPRHGRRSTWLEGGLAGESRLRERRSSFPIVAVRSNVTNELFQRTSSLSGLQWTKRPQRALQRAGT